MAINFPSTPSDGQTHTEAGVTWTYSSAKTAWYATGPEIPTGISTGKAIAMAIVFG